jgi:hypothetical protein
LFKISVIQLYDHLDSIGLLALFALLITVLLVFLMRYIAKFMIIFVILLSSLGSIGNEIFSFLIEFSAFNKGGLFKNLKFEIITKKGFA